VLREHDRDCLSRLAGHPRGDRSHRRQAAPWKLQDRPSTPPPRRKQGVGALRACGRRSEGELSYLAGPFRSVSAGIGLQKDALRTLARSLFRFRPRAFDPYISPWPVNGVSSAINGEHVEVVVVALAGRAGSRGALEEQHHAPSLRSRSVVSLDHHVGAREHGWRNFETERFRGLKI